MLNNECWIDFYECTSLSLSLSLSLVLVRLFFWYFSYNVHLISFTVHQAIDWLYVCVYIFFPLSLLERVYVLMDWHICSESQRTRERKRDVSPLCIVGCFFPFFGSIQSLFVFLFACCPSIWPDSSSIWYYVYWPWMILLNDFLTWLDLCLNLICITSLFFTLANRFRRWYCLWTWIGRYRSTRLHCYIYNYSSSSLTGWVSNPSWPWKWCHHCSSIGTITTLTRYWSP